jgi:pilus assembly protein TadC
MIVIGVILIAVAVFSTLLARKEDQSNPEVWDAFLGSSDDAARIVGRAARPLASTTAVRRSVESPAFRFLNGKLRLGGAFGGSMEVFFSVQLFTLLVGSALLLIVTLQPLPWFFAVPLTGIGFILPLWPVNETIQRANNKATSIALELPDFAELLAMVLPSMSVLQAITFTSEHTSGMVSVEMRELVRTLNSRTIPENEAFDLTASRLGTDDGKRFVDGLREAFLEGNRVVDNLTNQAEAMRRIAFQRQRAAVKKLPIKLTFIFALHFMPMLFALAFLPVVAGLAGAL